MQIDFGLIGCRIADDMGQVADIDPACSDIGRNEVFEVARLDLLNGTFASGLGQISRDLIRIESTFLQVASHIPDICLGVAKDDCALGIFVFKEACEKRVFLGCCAYVVIVLDLLRSALAVVDRNKLWFVEKEARKGANFFGDCG